MKNIHIIPTDQPSKIGYHFDIDLNGSLDYAPNFGFDEFNTERNFQHRPHFVYITSDEKIKEGDWYYDCGDANFVCKAFKHTTQQYQRDKIILTTDPKLIADGVQAIDDEFLEWYVKNSDCEFVELQDSKIVKEYLFDGTDDGEIIWEKRIIIPQKDSCPICDGTGEVVSSTTISRFKTCECMSLPQEESKTDLEIENYYIGKTLKLKKRLPSKYSETSLKESETIKIDKFIDGTVEGSRVAIGYKYGHEFLLFNIMYVESYMKYNFELIDEPIISQEESKFCEGQLRSLNMIDEKTEEYECIKCGQKYRYSGTHINRNTFSLTKCNKVKETILDKFLNLVSDEKSTWVKDLEHYNDNSEELDMKFEAELNDLITEQETLEEAAYRIYPRLINDPYNPKEDDNKEYRDIFTEGTRWQAERMFSEEEVLSILNKHRTHLYTIKSQSDNEWFEQFKKK